MSNLNKLLALVLALILACALTLSGVAEEAAEERTEGTLVFSTATFGQKFSCEFRSPVHFDSKRYFFDREDFCQTSDFFNIRFTDISRILGTKTFGVDKGTFQVNTGDLTTFYAGFDIIGCSLQCLTQGFFRQSESGGQ